MIQINISETKQGGCQGEGVREGWRGSLGLADANLYIGWINNKVLLFSIGN